MSLPREVVCRIIDFVMKDMEATKDGSAACAFLHCSRWTRYQVAKAFQPICIQEMEPPVPNESHKLRAERGFVEYMWASLDAWITDFSIREEGVGLPALLNNYSPIVTLEGLRGQEVECTVWVYLDAVPLPDGTIEPREKWCATGRWEAEHSGRVFDTVYDACAAMWDASKLVFWLMRFEPPDPDDPWKFPLAPLMRFSNPFNRALNGSLELPATGATITVELFLDDVELDPYDKDAMGHRGWLFRTTTEPE